MPVEFTKQGIRIDGEVWPLYSGTMHYWRHERALWGPILDNIKKMGFKIIETYIRWSVHELEEGVYDLGRIDPNKDVDGFLELCKEKGLKVFVRPGPHINAELTLFGYPERILYDPEVQARSPWGTPVIYPYFTKQYPIPGYASEKLYRECGKYFDALAPILLKHQHPRGAVVAIQIDNETNYFFRDRAYVMDYGKDSVRLYRQMLKEKYGEVEKLNELYGSRFPDFELVTPPAGFEGVDKKDLPYYFDWVEYKEYQISYALKRIAHMWKDRGITLPAYHNVSCQYYTPVDLVNIEEMPEIDVIGIDMYLYPKDFKEIRTKVKFMAGSSKLPYIPEYSSGVWFDNPRTLQPQEEEFTTLYCFMNGLKAINYYMLVERERWQGCPITRDNRIREEYFDFYYRFNRFLQESSLHRYERKPRVLVLKNFDMGRFKALYSKMDLNPFCSNTFVRGFELPAMLFKPDTDLGFKYMDGDFSHWAAEPWIDGITERLLEKNIDFNYSDTHLPLEKMVRYPVVFASAYDFMSAEEQQKLVRYAEQGGRLIVGPGLPCLDREMKECSLLGDYVRTKEEPGVVVCEDPHLLDLAPLGLDPEYKSSRAVELVVHRREDSRLLFAANVSDSVQQADISFEGTKEFKALWNGSDMSGKGEIHVTLPPYTVVVWEVK